MMVIRGGLIRVGLCRTSLKAQAPGPWHATAIDTKKSAGPDNLDPYLLKIAADIITEPVAHIFNLSLLTNSIPGIWKSAYVLPLLKGGDPSDAKNYSPISKLPILAKVEESLVNSQLNFLIEKKHTEQGSVWL
jgi:hypothetical protein